MRYMNLITIYRYRVLVVLSCLFLLPVRGLTQGFTILESLRDSKSESFTFDGNPVKAYLTSGVEDPAGDGWLRLTNDKTWQTGYAILNQSFPSNLGVLVDLEFMTWRSVYSSFGGADGFSVFLFDATALPFNIGAFGGSLGYAQYNSSGVVKPGLSGGFMGIGIDEYGNFSNSNEGRNGGPGFLKNSIGLRGSASDGYKWIAGKTSLSFSLQYGQSGTRPNDNQYYRRIQIEIKPLSNVQGTKYSISVRIKNSKSGAFEKVFGPFILDNIPPALLKLGFAASTGIAVNYHEVRNLVVTTPDGISVNKSVNKSVARIGDELTYIVNLNNQTDTIAKGLEFKDVLPANFAIESITFDNLGDALNTATGYTQTDLSNVKVTLNEYGRSRFIVRGKVTGRPDTGILTNTAEFNVGTSGVVDPDLANNTASVSTEILSQNEKITLVKNVSNSKQFALGDEIRYNFTVNNPGEVPLNRVTVTDSKLASAPVYVSGDTNSNTILEPGESWIYSGSYIVKQADLDSGRVVNQAWVTSIDPAGSVVKDTSGTSADNDAPTVTPITQLSKITLVKSVSSTGPYTLGSTIRYLFAVGNAGNTSLSNVSVSDNKLLTPPVYQSGDLNKNSKLDVGEIWYYTGEYIVKPADISANRITNSALASANDPAGKPITDISGNTVNDDNATDVVIDQAGKIALVKAISSAGPFALGDLIPYSFTVINTGNVPLKDIKVEDPRLATPINYISGDANANGVLDVNESWIFKGNYRVTQADVTAAKVVNSATVTAKDPSSNTVTDVSGPTALEDTPTSTPINQTPRLAVIKAVNNTGVFRLGDVIKYDITVVNTGDVPLTGVSVKDSLLSDRVTPLSKGNGDNTLDVGEIWVFRGEYKVTQADVDSGSVSNIAKVTAVSPQGKPVEDNSGSTTINDQPTVTPIAQSGKVALIKAVNGSGPYALDSTITYAFTVVNTGTVALSGVMLDDPKLIGGLSSLKEGDLNKNGKLDVGEIWTYTGSYKVQQSDIDAGSVVNLCTVTAKDPQGNEVSDKSGSAINNNNPTTTQVNRSAKIAIVKNVVSSGPFRIGNDIEYSFTVRNTGNVTLSTPVVTDTRLNLSPVYQSGDTNGNEKLDVGEEWIFTGHYVVTRTDVNNGTVRNTAIATAYDPQGNPVRDQSGATFNDDYPTVTPVIQAPLAVNDEASTRMNFPVSIPVTGNDIPGGADLNPASVQVISQPLHGTLEVNADGTITYIPEEGYAGTDIFTYRVKDQNGFWSNIAEVKITIDALFIPNVFTPNADGKNDYFEIPGLNSLTRVELQVFNRWGSEVFRSPAYHNEWDGHGLNDGTYYYVLKWSKSGKEYVYKGWVLLKR